MKLKLTKKLNDLEPGTVIEVKDTEADALIKEGHTVYTDAEAAAEKVAAAKVYRESAEKEAIMEEKEIKKEVAAPAVVGTKSTNTLGSIHEIATKLMSGEVKELTTKVPAGMNEDTANADGGYLVSHEIYGEILGRLFEGGKVYPKVKKIQVGPNYNGMKLPYLNITGQTTTTQPRLYRLAEGGVKTPTKFTFGQHNCSLVKLIALVPITQELLQDKVTLESYVFSQLKGQFAWRLDNDLLYGTAGGTGHIGILDASGAAFLATNIAHGATPSVTMVNNVINGVAPQVRNGAEWFVSGDMWAYIMATMGPGVANVLVPIAFEAGGNRTLQGYPVNLVDGMVAHNTAKDMLFMNPKELVVIEKGGLAIDISKEFYFDTDQVALRFVMRTAGAPVFAKYTAGDGKDYAAASATS